MSATATDTRTARVELIIRELVPRASQLTRLVLGQARGEISRAEGGILRTLSAGPRRITELAELEGLAQPTTTALVNRLERHGWVARGRDASDGRAVLVSLTPSGADALERYRAQYRAILRDRLSDMSDEQISALEGAIGALGALVDAVQKGGGR